MRSRKGFTLIEILLVILIFALLSAVGTLGASRHIERGRIDQTTASLEIFSANLEDAINDMGEIDLERATSSAEKVNLIRQYFDEVSHRYLGFKFDFTTLETTAYGFNLAAEDYKDAWGNACKLFVATEDGIHNRYTLASPGADGIWNDSTYAEAKYADDILLIAVVK